MCLQCLQLSCQLWVQENDWYFRLARAGQVQRHHQREVLWQVLSHFAASSLDPVPVVLAWLEVVDLVQFDLHWKNLKEVVFVVHALVVRVVVADQVEVRPLEVAPSC